MQNINITNNRGSQFTYTFYNKYIYNIYKQDTEKTW